MNSFFRIGLLAVAMGVVGAASATVTFVNPFVGSYSENFESQTVGLDKESVTGMDGNLTIFSEAHQAGVYNGPWSAGGGIDPSDPNESDTVANGTKFGVGNAALDDDLQPEAFSFNFTGSTQSFGGYFAANGVAHMNTLTVDLYNVNQLVGTLDWTYEYTTTDTTQKWLGFTSSAAFTRMVFSGAQDVSFDNLQASPNVVTPPVPEPAPVAALALGALGLVRRRRRA